MISLYHSRKEMRNNKTKDFTSCQGKMTERMSADVSFKHE